jgi:MoaA/NifB/PqqE/SkfB family radical SAM enzyme
MEKIFFCKMPWEGPIEIRSDGNVYPCCMGWTDYPLGNWLTNTFDTIWNGDLARELRRTILDGSYRLCKLKRCLHYGRDDSLYGEEQIKRFTEISPPPKIVAFCHEKVCNVRCVMCRDVHIHNNEEQTRILDERIETVFLPMVTNADEVLINGEGEALSSKHCRKLIKTIAQRHPSVKFNICSNGILVDKQNFESLGIIDKVADIIISLHAVKKTTYNRIVLDSDFIRIIKNIEWLSSMKKNGKIRKIKLVSVVSALNYREMPEFVEMARKYGATVNFLEFYSWDTKMGQNYDKMAVFKEWHPEYNNYVKIINSVMQDEDLKKSVSDISPLLYNLRPINAGKWLKYRLNGLKNRIGFRLPYRILRKIYRIAKYAGKDVDR